MLFVVLPSKYVCIFNHCTYFLPLLFSSHWYTIYPCFLIIWLCFSYYFVKLTALWRWHVPLHIGYKSTESWVRYHMSLGAMDFQHEHNVIIMPYIIWWQLSFALSNNLRGSIQWYLLALSHLNASHLDQCLYIYGSLSHM